MSGFSFSVSPILVTSSRTSAISATIFLFFVSTLCKWAMTLSKSALEGSVSSTRFRSANCSALTTVLDASSLVLACTKTSSWSLRVSMSLFLA